MAKVEHFFDKENISWASLCGVCTDGAPAMLEAKSGFQTLVKNKAPNLVTTHCFIHREALASKTLRDNLKCAFDEVVKSVNYIKNSALNTRLFRKLCEDLNSEHKQMQGKGKDNIQFLDFTRAFVEKLGN